MPRKKKAKPSPEPEASTALVPIEDDRHQDLGALADRLTGDAPAPEPEPDPNPPIDAEFTVKPDKGYADEQLHRICAAEKEVQDLESVWEEKKEDAKVAKDDYDEAVAKLRHLIQESSKDDASMPLFPNTNGQAAAPTTTDAEVEDESWKKVPLAEALEGISAVVIEKLKDAELETVGQLEAFINMMGLNGHSDPLTTIKGIGEATARKIAEAFEKFWQRRNG